MIDRVAKSVTRNPLLRYLAVGIVCAVAGGVAGGVSALSGADGVLEVIVKAGAMTAAMAVGLVVCNWWWQGLDEAAREAHKWAWWWGSTFGLAIGGVALLTLMAAGGEGGGLLADQAPVDVFMTGAFVIVGMQTAGYAIAWAFWWLQRR